MGIIGLLSRQGKRRWRRFVLLYHLLPFTQSETDPKKFGSHVEVFVRTSAELRDIIDKNPFQGQQSKESKWVVVMFLAARPDDRAQDDLLKTYVGPEELVIIGKEMYIYYTNVIGR